MSGRQRQPPLYYYYYTHSLHHTKIHVDSAHAVVLMNNAEAVAAGGQRQDNDRSIGAAGENGQVLPRGRVSWCGSGLMLLRFGLLLYICQLNFCLACPQTISNHAADCCSGPSTLLTLIDYSPSIVARLEHMTCSRPVHPSRETTTKKNTWRAVCSPQRLNSVRHPLDLLPARGTISGQPVQEHFWISG